jgi:uncharacterized membrane protein
VTYTSLAAELGLATARRWFLATFAAAFVVAALSSATGWPLGPIRFTDRLGPRLAHVPLGWPLLWCTVVFGARSLLRRLAPRAAHRHIAIGVGFLALLTDLNLEPVAWNVRGFWIWYPAQLPAPPTPPVQNAFTWFAFAAALAYAFRSREVAAARTAPYPVAAFSPLLLLNALLFLARLPGR